MASIRLLNNEGINIVTAHESLAAMIPVTDRIWLWVLGLALNKHGLYYDPNWEIVPNPNIPSFCLQAPALHFYIFCTKLWVFGPGLFNHDSSSVYLVWHKTNVDLHIMWLLPNRMLKTPLYWVNVTYSQLSKYAT